MPKFGPDRTVSNDRLLLEFVLRPDPAFFASEFTTAVGLTRQTIDRRLKELEEQGYVDSKIAGPGRIWWITDSGRDRVAAATREKFDED